MVVARQITSAVTIYSQIMEDQQWRPDRPRWLQLAEIIQARIDEGAYRPGQPIPSEPALVREFGIARTTVRKATKHLRSLGLIYTVRSLGSFVSEDDH
jgi:GntR family transcriptional regulator